MRLFFLSLVSLIARRITAATASRHNITRNISLGNIPPSNRLRTSIGALCSLALFLSAPLVASAAMDVFPSESLALFADEDLQLDDSLSINAGATFDASATSSSITLFENWSNQGTFGAGDVIFAGSAPSTISGNTTFRSLTCQTGGKILGFEAGSTQTISDELILAGQDTANKLTLSSTAPGTRYTIDLQSGHTTVAFLNVRDSNLLTNTILPTGSTDSGNNSDLWLFSIRISGQILSGGTPLAGVTVDAGVLGSAVTDAQGNFVISDVPYGGNYTLSLSKPGYTFSPATLSGSIANHVVANFTALADVPATTTTTIGATTTIGTTTTISATTTSVPSAGDIAVSVLFDGVAFSDVKLDGGALGTRTTDAEGRAVYGSVATGASYSITPTKRGFGFSPASSAGVKEAGDSEITFAASPRAIVTGRVMQVTAGGSAAGDAAVPGATVELRVELDGEDELLTTVADEDGYYEFPAVSYGDATIIAVKNGVTISRAEVRLTVGQGETDVALPVTVLGLEKTSYGWWNGFLGMSNVLELVNKGTEKLVVTVTVLPRNGQDVRATATTPNTASARQTLRYTIAVGKQLDVVLNDKPNFERDSYGLVVVTTNHTDYDGRVALYREAKLPNYDFNYTVPLSSGIKGSSFVPFNTYQPSGDLDDKDSIVANWISIGNNESNAEKFVLKYYNERGTQIFRRTVLLAAHGRLDFQAGHEYPGMFNIGLISITPRNSSASYEALLTRYAYKGNGEFSYAFGIPAVAVGNQSRQVLPIGAVASAMSTVELANVSSKRARVAVKVYNQSGKLAKSVSIALNAKAQYHLVYPNLPLGSVVIEPEARLLVGAGVYYYDSDKAVSAAEYSSGIEPLGAKLTGSYNVYLDMQNWLRLINPSGNTTRVKLSAAGSGAAVVNKTYKLAPHARRDVGIHELVDKNTYGAISLTLDKAGSLASQALRVKHAVDGVTFEVTSPVTVR